MDFAAEKKLPLTMTCARNKLPNGVPSKYWHKEQTKADARSRAARWLKPIFAIKEHKGSTLQFCSFQSTSSCNIVSVNAINSISLFASTKERGRGTNKRQWGIEMNESRQLYLATYGIIDTIDQMIDNCNMFYRSWKYWHAAMNHGKKLAVVVAYDIYLELASGHVTSEWKVDKPVSFHRFREKLALQMLSYNPTKWKYPGDEKARAKKPKAKHYNRSPCSPLVSSPAASIASTEKKRFCGDLYDLNKHISSVKKLPNNGRKCDYCGDMAYQRCGLCDKTLHYYNPIDGLSVPCFFLYHDQGAAGTARSDCSAMGTPKRKFKRPRDASIESNRKALKRALTSNNNASTLANSQVDMNGADPSRCL